MKKVGLIGGLGPASTVDYYNGIVAGYSEKFGADRYPEILLYSVDMSKIIGRVLEEDYDTLGEILAGYAEALKAAGADFVAICANTPHIAIENARARTNVPFLGLIEAICDEVKLLGYKKTLVLGTSWTMRNGLFSNAFSSAGLGYALPTDENIEKLGAIIYPNLENGIIIPEDRVKMLAIAEEEISRNGCDAALLGCTEIPLMIKEGDLSVPIINSTELHIRKILEKIIN